MTTARDIVDGALQRIRVVGISSSSVPAEYQVYVLGMLNDMLHGWQTQGIDLKISDLGINDTFCSLSRPLASLAKPSMPWRLKVTGTPRPTHRR